MFLYQPRLIIFPQTILRGSLTETLKAHCMRTVHSAHTYGGKNYSFCQTEDNILISEALQCEKMCILGCWGEMLLLPHTLLTLPIMRMKINVIPGLFLFPTPSEVK